jgi:hypothetical protein
MRSVCVLVLLASPAAAADLAVRPAAVALAGRDGVQQLLVVEQADGRTVADRTAAATYTTSDPKVAAVSADGEVTAVGDGTATVTATVNGRRATATVTVTGAAAPPAVGFRSHVLPVLTRAGCNGGACHGALAGKGGLKLSLRGYDPDADFFALTRQAVARRVDTAAPERSLLLTKATRAVPHAGGRRFEADGVHYRRLLAWVAAGAPGPADADPQVERLELLPGPALLKPKDTLRIVALAHYTDGTVRDVTRWTRFGSSEETVAAVDEDGTLTVAGPGEAGVTAAFGTRVAVLPVTVPLPTSVPDEAYAKAGRANLIDEHVLRKLKLLRIPPSPPATDAEFVRRASLDACGLLPTPEEVAAFAADPSPDKRAKLVDRLLARPEYVDYWAHKWSDLLLVSTRKLPAPAMWAFYRSVRQAVADNRPWVRFARDMVTASGSTLGNGLANYFVLHKDVADLSETTAVTFLGMSVTCARCHNHPLEKWTQDQYWAMANLFARVGLKNGERPGEVIVRPLPDGDALHLRRGTPMPPAPLDAPPLPADGPADRRAYFADWLTSPQNPYFAKALVNRVWRNFFGRGLVEAEDDLRETNPPSNAELFDALAVDFVASRYDVKHLVRTIMLSAAYGRSSRPVPGNEADDRYGSRYVPRRLSAEVILDAQADVTGVPTPFDQLRSNAGDALTATKDFPTGTRATQLPDSLAASRFLEAFGRADRVQTCSCERTADSSVTQALHLNNGRTLNDKLRAPTGRLAKWLTEGLSDAEIVSRLYRHALSREPTAAEMGRLVPVLAAAEKLGPAARREAAEDVAWAVLTSQEFLFNR